MSRGVRCAVAYPPFAGGHPHPPQKKHCNLTTPILRVPRTRVLFSLAAAPRRGGRKPTAPTGGAAIIICRWEAQTMPQDQTTPPLTVARARREYARAEPGYRTKALLRLQKAVKEELKRAAEVEKQNG